MRLLLSLIVLLSHAVIMAQHEYSLEFNLGISKVYDNNAADLVGGQVRYARSECAQFQYTNLQDNGTAFRTGIKYVDIRGINILDVVIGINGFPTGLIVRAENSIRLQYLSLPLLFGYHKPKFKIFGGFQAGLLIRDRSVETGSFVIMNQLLPYIAEFDGLDLKPWDFGILASFEFYAHERIAFTAGFYQGSANISDSTEPDRTWRTQQITIGIKYDLAQH